jgi:hypothetical protein
MGQAGRGKDGGVRTYYVCENCGRLAQIDGFYDDCKPGWTHGRLIKVTELPTELREPLYTDGNYGPEEGPGCPVWLAHLLYNYDECNKDESILHLLIPRTPDGLGNEQCSMFVESND